MWSDDLQPAIFADHGNNHGCVVRADDRQAAAAHSRLVLASRCPEMRDRLFIVLSCASPTEVGVDPSDGWLTKIIAGNKPH